MNMIQSAKDQVLALTMTAYETAAAEGLLPADAAVKPSVEIPKDTANGDYTTTFCLAAAKALHKNPRQVAQILMDHMQLEGSYFTTVEMAGPGFLNFRLGDKWFGDTVACVEREGADYGSSDMLAGKKYMVEFVSANPTGPMHMGNARGGVLGDTLASVLQKSGADVWREFYVNDAGNQIVMLGESLTARYFEHFGKEYPLPEGGYHADDIKGIAAQLAEEEGDKWLTADPKERLAHFMDYGKKKELEKIDRDLKAYRVTMQSWMHETFFYENNAKRINDCLQHMADMGLTYEKDGALWFKSTDYGDEKDRVLRKSDGSLTYFASDIAYHDDKYRRGFDRVVDVWGADHHGYVPRMKAAVQAVGRKAEDLDVVLIQLVNLLENGTQVAMSTRAGQFETLADVVKEVGVDAARFMFLSRKSDSHLDFDLALVKQRSMDNPVYYVQYAHARVRSVLRKAAEAGLTLPEKTDLALLAPLSEAEDLALLHFLDRFEDVAKGAAQALAPHHISYYLMELAGMLHSYYAKHPVLQAGDPELALARLALLRSVGQVVKNGLELLGVSAPESM